MKKIVSIVVFVIVSFYCMMSGMWILWAGIVAMLYIDNLVDSTKKWLDDRQVLDPDAMKKMQTSLSDNSNTLQSIQQSVLKIEQRMDALEEKKSV